MPKTDPKDASPEAPEAPQSPPRLVEVPKATPEEQAAEIARLRAVNAQLAKLLTLVCSSLDEMRITILRSVKVEQ